jgi:hypothetical protein
MAVDGRGGLMRIDERRRTGLQSTIAEGKRGADWKRETAAAQARRRRAKKGRSGEGVRERRS